MNYLQNYTEGLRGGTENHRKKIRAMDANKITEKIIGCAIEVHKLLGPGLLESAYEDCLAYELVKSGFKVERQKAIPVIYKEIQLECGYRIDILVEDLVILELKAVESINPVYEAQLLTYLRFSKKRIGLLINFHVPVLKNGIRRFIR